MCTCRSRVRYLDALLAGGAVDDAVHVDVRHVDVVRVDLADLDELLDLDDRRLDRLAHGRVEVVARLPAAQVRAHNTLVAHTRY